ncbi:ABC-three component system middle component 1 [Flavisolibacter tropicus]|uniref:Uncharacterized protein n=1 Tax=Flavisolibacter tropicus TaxID=1492898 RepID=A0A172TU31_9BACT|nr:ABC-three component system middle component 1 [Flavisolibacter tropicus]ANE50621.1 hypothetical protein SY85_09025 [Flavisolibacter tropicus]
MVYSNNTPDIIAILKDEYKDLFIKFKSIDYRGLISLFIVQVSSNELLSNYWDKISGSIAAYYQPYLSNDFEKWNIYIMYISTIKVDQHLKYKIENDRFSSRKIVIDQFNKEVNDLTIEDLVIDHITNKDLPLRTVQRGKIKGDYTSSSPIWNLLSKTSLKRGNGRRAEADVLLQAISTKLGK